MRGFVIAGLCVAALLAAGPQASAKTVPIPRPKPMTIAPAALQVPVLIETPDMSEEEIAPTPVKFGKLGSGNWPRSEVAQARALCAKLLAGRRITWAPEPPLGRPRGCGTAQPIAVSAIAGVAIAPPATLNCQMAAATHDWITEIVQPAAKKHVGRKVTLLVNASSYACRRRNNGRRGKMSEHAFANAFDIADFQFGKGRVASVRGHWSGFAQLVGLSGRGNFLRSVRKGACGHFNTILGPGSDAHHKDHLHLDLMRLRPGRFKMCR